jgi:serine protease AprX
LVSIVVSALLLGWHPPSQADGFAEKSAPQLRQRLVSRPLPGFTSVIIKIAGDLTPAREQQLRALGGDIYRYLPLIQAVALRVPTRWLPRLAALPFVTHLSEDARVQQKDAFTVGSSGAGVAYQQDGLTGLGITAAVLDSGIYAHPDLADPTTKRSRILASVNFVSTALNANDQYGHGTHVAGILAGNGAASTGSAYYQTFYGIARRANLINVRVLDALGDGDTSAVIAGIQWVVQNKAAYNIRILNLSLGHSVTESYTTDPLCQAVEQAWQAGIVVVCAAGNDGRQYPLPLFGTDNEGYGTSYGSIYSPANDPYVIAVGAMKSVDGVRAHDQIATYSSRGPTSFDMVVKPDLVAPGNQVISLLDPTGTLALTNLTYIVPPSAYMVHPTLLATSSYLQLSGTSMATAVVSGAVALLLQADPSLSPDTVKLRLMTSADRWCFPDGTSDANTFGTGYLDIPAALNCTSIAAGYALSPAVTFDSQGDPILDITTLVWSTLALWGLQSGGTQALWTDFRPPNQPERPSRTNSVIALPILANPG